MATTVVAGRVAETRAVNPVPNPFPLTLAGMLAALGPQAINFGISIGGGEAYLLPNVSARGTLHMHWLMTISVILETALVYECIKYSICTGRSFFAATNDLGPRGFWPARRKPHPRDRAEIRGSNSEYPAGHSPLQVQIA